MHGRAGSRPATVSNTNKNMINSILLIISFTLLLTMSFALVTFSQTDRFVSIEGHRGARGYLPENTIPSFLKAIEQGADTLELDVVISKDKKVVISHEPWFSSVISTDPKGQRISKETERDHNMYKMTYAEIKRYDVGSIGNVDFPQQVKMKAYKPLMTDLFIAAEKYAKKNKLGPIRYNIEIKSNPQGDGVFHPAPEEFAALVLADVKKHNLEKQIIIQSFDVRPLQVLRKTAPDLPLSFLVSNKDGVEKNIALLGFIPDTYSPHFSLVTKELVDYCRRSNMKIVPWTINEIADLERMKQFDLDGIITDYPDRAVKVFRN